MSFLKLADFTSATLLKAGCDVAQIGCDVVQTVCEVAQKGAKKLRWYSASACCKAGPGAILPARNPRKVFPIELRWRGTSTRGDG